MNNLLTLIADLMYAYGKDSAGMPSRHGSYEEEVPQSLRNCDDK